MTHMNLDNVKFNVDSKDALPLVVAWKGADLIPFFVLCVPFAIIFITMFSNFQRSGEAVRARDLVVRADAARCYNEGKWTYRQCHVDALAKYPYSSFYK